MHEAQTFSSTPATKPQYPLQRFSVAPMLDWTDRHCRYFHRLLTKQALLYTEMVTTGAIIHGKADYLAYSEAGPSGRFAIRGQRSTGIGALCQAG